MRQLCRRPRKSFWLAQLSHSATESLLRCKRSENRILWVPKISSGAGADASMGYPDGGMTNLLSLLGGFLVGLFRSRAAREAEIAFLRQQLLVATRSAPARLRLRTADRLVFVWLYRLFPALLRAAIIFKPETLLRWYRSGFRCTGAGSRVVVSAGLQSPPRSEIWSGQSAATIRFGVRQAFMASC